MSHMTQTANPVTLLASPLGEEGHEVAKGWTVVRMIMILDVDVTAERRHYNTHRPRGRYHNPRPEGPSNLRTLRPTGRSILRTLFHNPFPQPAADRRPQPSGRSPVNPHARRACPRILFFQYAAEGVFFSDFSVFHVDALDFRGEAGEGVDAVY